MLPARLTLGRAELRRSCSVVNCWLTRQKLRQSLSLRLHLQPFALPFIICHVHAFFLFRLRFLILAVVNFWGIVLVKRAYVTLLANKVGKRLKIELPMEIGLHYQR